MDLSKLPSGITDWSALAPSNHSGESGFAIARVRQFGDVQVRLVEYSPGYVGDHWCNKGHIAFVVAGQMQIERRDGTIWIVPAGTTWLAADNDGSPHRACSREGASVFIVD